MTIAKFLDPKNDISFKRIFGSEKNKDILIGFINDILEYKNDKKISSVEFLPPVLEPEVAGKKFSIVDILCRTETGEKIIVEMQIALDKGFEKRAQYYAAKAYSRQLDYGTGKYSDLKGVVFIAISNSIIFKNKKQFKSDHAILDKSSHENDLKDFKFTFIELPKFEKTIESLTSMIDKWCYFFKHAKDTDEKDAKKLGSYSTLKNAFSELNKFNWQENELDAYEMRMNAEMALDGAFEKKFDDGEERGLEKGLIKGKRQGLKEGKKQGLMEGKKVAELEYIKKMAKMGLDPAKIAKVTGLSLEQVEAMYSRPE